MVKKVFIGGLTAVAAMLATAMPSVALAQDPRPASFSADPFSALVGERRSEAARLETRDVVERYLIATDDRVFLFQPGPRDARLKFLCGDGDTRIDCIIDEATPAEEIYLLTATRAPRGDTVWRDTGGEALLRVSAYGGATVFWPGDPRGLAASKSYGEDPLLTLEFATVETARARAQRATAIISAKVGAPVLFNIGDPAADAGGGASVLADAVARAAKGLGRVADDPTGARIIAGRIRSIAFTVGRPPAVGLSGGVLSVRYDPAADAAGRPSSSEIASFLEASL
ncbi:MAG: DUF4908 domain-containing protein [Parvularculaceae bacterium]